MRLKLIAPVLAVAALGLASAPVAADPKHCPPGHAKKGWCGGGRDDHAYREGYRDGQRDTRHHRYRRGERITHEHYVVIEPDSYGLAPPRRGYRYVNAGGDILLVAIATGVIAEILLND